MERYERAPSLGERERAMTLEHTLDPLPLIDEWREQARAAGSRIPEVATLATVAPDGAPRARVVLVRRRVERTFHFFTNYESDKARELAAEPRAALCMHHVELGVQARIEGRTSRLSEADSDAYFRSRPRLSQLGAWASDQSRPLASRQELEARLDEVTTRFAGAPVPRPPNWGGYGLTAERVELWLDRDGRLHERRRFSFADGRWTSELLWP